MLARQPKLLATMVEVGLCHSAAHGDEAARLPESPQYAYRRQLAHHQERPTDPRAKQRCDLLPELPPHPIGRGRRLERGIGNPTRETAAAGREPACPGSSITGKD